MSGSVADKKRLIRVTEGNLKNNHLYVTGHYDFFPPDCIGAPRKNRKGAAPAKNDGHGKPIDIYLDGLNVTIQTDIGTDARTGKPRRMFRERKPFAVFFKHHSVRAGDVLAIEKVQSRSYRLVLSNRGCAENNAIPSAVATATTNRNSNGSGGPAFLPTAIELFAGCGGLALGFEQAGFQHKLAVEWDSDACKTLRRNLGRTSGAKHAWNLVEGDISGFDFRPFEGKVAVVSGGPPCQPFSIGGKHRGMDDPRNMFPQAVRAVREVKPAAFVFENVKGFLRPGFRQYFDYILLQLTFPEIGRRPNEDWLNHLFRLQTFRKAASMRGLRYAVSWQVLNAADFGVAQRRERVFIVGIREDLKSPFTFPARTHCEDPLLYDLWITGDYWDRHRLPKCRRPAIPPRLRPRLDRVRSSIPGLLSSPWRTVRDAIADLPALERRDCNVGIANHRFNPGARSYPGHDGSPLDEPAKTLKAGDHGVPGGENTLRLDNGDIRYFSVRECARLQSFPDDWVFEGSWTESMRQLGNAVPVLLGRTVASHLRQAMKLCKGTG